MFDIPEYKKIRVIIDTDAACEADDPFAIVQALLSPKLIVKGIAAEHFVEKGSMERSYDEIRTILKAMDIDVPVLKGQNGPLCADAECSEAASFIIDEAMREDEHPLFVLCQGAISNVAMALKTKPEIKDRMTVIHLLHPKTACRHSQSQNILCVRSLRLYRLLSHDQTARNQSFLQE